MRHVIVIASACLALAACSQPSGPAGTVSTATDSGVTASNGGGARANSPNVSVGGGGATVTPAPNSKGATY